VKSQIVQIKLQLDVNINLHVVPLAGKLAEENCAQSMLTVINTIVKAIHITIVKQHSTKPKRKWKFSGGFSFL
tara:strand:- start:1123 stop:1341 length:219 start_codon:yes stop_codon:yes gene_type:complete